MTPTQLKEAAQVMLAAAAAEAEGKHVQVQFMRRATGDWVPTGWSGTSRPNWDWQTFTFRIKPEPREWWLDPRTGMVWEFKMKEAQRGNLIKVREVIE